MALSYFLNRKSSVVVLSLNGAASGSDVPILQKCLEELKPFKAKYLIINLGGVNETHHEFLRPFTIFQQNLREICEKLYVCNVKSNILSDMKAGGVVREAECFSELMGALQAILQLERK